MVDFFRGSDFFRGRCGEKIREVWESVLGGGVEKVKGRCGEKCRGCGEVCWGIGKCVEGMGKYVGVWMEV